MGHIIAFLLNFTILAVPFTLAIVPNVKQNQMAALLQNVLNPGNADRARQILQLTASGNNKISSASPVMNLLQEITVPNARSPVPVGKQLPIQRQLVNQVVEVIQPKMQEIALPVAPVYQEIYPAATPCASPVPVQEVAYPYPYPAMPVQEVAYPYPYPGAPMSPVPQKAYPAPLINPFLPAASPVSALAPPTSSLLPPVDLTQVRSNYLRKIPIPPPSI